METSWASLGVWVLASVLGQVREAGHEADVRTAWAQVQWFTVPRSSILQGFLTHPSQGKGHGSDRPQGARRVAPPCSLPFIGNSSGFFPLLFLFLKLISPYGSTSLFLFQKAESTMGNIFLFWILIFRVSVWLTYTWRFEKVIKREKSMRFLVSWLSTHFEGFIEKNNKSLQ